MSGRFKYEHLPKYPHMKPEDILVWERFIRANPAYFDTCDYDVACGKGADTNPDHPPEIQYDHTILTQKKIDVLGWRGDLPFIVEVGPVADMRKLGQILTYKRLFTQDHPEYPNPQAIVVCGSIEREIDALFEEHGITVEIA